MKTKQLTAIGNQLLQNLPGFAAHKDLLFKLPVEDTLRGVWFVASSDANIFYCSVFFLPLFIPRDSVDLTHGKRIRINGRERLSANDPNLIVNLNEAIHGEANPFLDNVSTLTSLLNYLKTDIEEHRPRVNTYILEALAYTLIKNGDYTSALESLTELKQILARSVTQGGLTQKARAQLIEEKLLSKPEAALAQLEAWKTETVNKLGLKKYIF